MSKENNNWWDLNNYDYDLPEDLIAQHPADQRDHSRLLVYRNNDHTIEHRTFKNLPNFIGSNDLLVVNDCRVIPARLYAQRSDTGTKIEIFLTRQTGSTVWQALAKPGRSCKVGVTLNIGEHSIKVLKVKDDGQRVIEFQCSVAEMEDVISAKGVIPLPPYIERKNKGSAPEDIDRYQTVYAKKGQAVAAPTAGLHFTEELMAKLEAQGTQIARVRLDVGLGTFLPVKSTDLRDHKMHHEYCQITAETAAKLNQVRDNGGRIIAVGTTSLRVLESCLDDNGRFCAYQDHTDIFIHPPKTIKSIDGLITNYHLPKSTLLMLVAAWTSTTEWRRIYEEAIKLEYRFYSYGDSMLLLR